MADPYFFEGANWRVEQSDAVAWLDSLPAQSVDLTMFSPPYERARDYLEDGENLNIARDTETWVAWMLTVMKAALRVTKGLVVCVCEGQTNNYRYSGGPVLLWADLIRAGICTRKAPIFRRVGIPGSGGNKKQHAANGGGADWWRSDWEFCLACTNGGKLPWADGCATGSPPKFPPGGAMSYRNAEGERKNARDKPETKKKRLGRGKSPAGDGSTKGTVAYKLDPESYAPPALANPGNVVQQLYTAQEVAALLGEQADIIDCKVGGGLMGSKLASENEAPFPEALVEPFVRCFAPEGGTVADCFAGSSTTGAVALKWGRKYLGCDLRRSQVDLSARRLRGEPDLFSVPAE